MGKNDGNGQEIRPTVLGYGNRRDIAPHSFDIVLVEFLFPLAVHDWNLPH